MSQHNEKNWKEFIRLRELIKGKPLDVQLLKKELKENYYQQRLNSLSDLRRHLSDEFEENFFSRATRNFFGPHKIKFSKRDLMVYCILRTG
jgi:hypothetical protein